MHRLLTISAAFVLAAACSKEPQGQGATPGNALAPAAKSTAAPAESAASAPAGAPAETAVPAASSGVDTVKKASAGVEYREVTLPTGTELPVDLETALGSDTSRVEQPVRGKLRHAVSEGGVEVLPAGTAISGHVTAAERPGRVKGRGTVAFRFTELDTPGEGTSRISTATISREAPATKQKDTLSIVAPAAAGAVIGRIAGGKGAARKGAVIGGAAGTGYVLSTRGKDVRIARGADFAVKLTAPLTVRVPVRK
jgi:hypothetical protein